MVFGTNLGLGERALMGHVIQAEQMHGWLHDMTGAAGAAQGLSIPCQMALSAFRLRVVRQRCLRQWRQHWDEELGEEAVELSAIDFGTDQGEGIGTGQAG